MAAEFDSGRLVTLFERLTAKSGERPPDFEPGRQDEYWSSFSMNFDPGQATRAIEDAAVVHGRIACIDFRVPLNDRHETMHLHLETRGRYMTNVLAYRLVRRGTSNGLRIVATMMDGPDFNVLAIYEK